MQVTGTFTVTVGPGVTPPPALAITPSTGTLPPFTEGVDIGSVAVATVSGGTPPYTYDVEGLPAGLVASEDGSGNVTLSGVPAAGDAANSPYTVTVTATDSAASTAKFSFKSK